MLTLNDGRSELWQWDTGRKLTVDADCSQVHFSNKVFGRSIDVDVMDGLAIIPDILLQTDKELTAWAFVGTPENGYTKISKVFKVNKRNKPADYVFTPAEQTTLDEIMKRLSQIEESQDPDAIKNAVDEYLANNPIQVEEKDPNVPDWAKQPTKPEYTVQEVGAVATVNGIAPDENGNVQIPVSGGNADQGGSGLSTTAKNLLITILRNGVYSTDQSENITALETALGSSGGGGNEEPDTPDVPDVPVVNTYTISNELVNVTSNNSAQSVALGNQYSATLSANEGYMLPSSMGGTITITMGGTDITSEVYNYDSGKIVITSVTGNVVIQASAFAEPKLIEDGLVSFFDLRSAEISTSGNYKYIGATIGNGGLFYNNVDKEVTAKGIVFGNDRPTYTKDGSIAWTDYAGTDNQYTIVTCYYAPGKNGYSTPFANAVLEQAFPNWHPTMKYVNTSGEKVTKQSDAISPSATKAGFIAGAVSVGADKAVFATADVVVATFDASSYEDFSHFNAYANTGVVNPNRAEDSVTFYAMYDRALSEAEITEVLNFMLTEVAG